MDDRSNVAIFISYAWGGSLEKRMGPATDSQQP